MPKRPAKKNNFMLFTELFRKRQSERGITYCSLADAIKAADPVWKSLTPEEKEDYKRQCKSLNTEKFTTDGISYAEIERKQSDLKRHADLETATIDKMVEDAVRAGKLASTSFCIVHSNYYYATSSKYYATCEIAIAEFSLERGVICTYSCLPDAPIRDGYLSDATARSKELCIDLPPLADAERDFIAIYTSVLGICAMGQCYDDSPPPVFAMPDDIEPVQCFLDQLSERFSGPDEQTKFTVYSLPLLYFRIRNEIAKMVNDIGVPTISIALHNLSVDSFEYCGGVSCDYHKDTEKYFLCSEAIVRRKVFKLCDECCGPLGIRMLPGKHCPNEAIYQDMTLIKPENKPDPFAFAQSKQSERNVQPAPVLSGGWQGPSSLQCPVRKPQAYTKRAEENAPKIKMEVDVKSEAKDSDENDRGGSGFSYSNITSGRGRGIISLQKPPGEPDIKKEGFPQLQGIGRGRGSNFANK